MTPNNPSSSLALRSTGFVGLALLLLLGIFVWIRLEPITVTERPSASKTPIANFASVKIPADTHPALIPTQEPATFDPHPFDVSLTLKPDRNPPPSAPKPLILSTPGDGSTLRLWGQMTIGKVHWQFPNLRARLQHQLRRLRFGLTGVELRLPDDLSLDMVVSQYASSRFDTDHDFTVFFAPGLGEGNRRIHPVTRTNAAGVEVLPMTLDRLLASNGLQVIHRSQHKIMIVPSNWTNLVPELPMEMR